MSTQPTYRITDALAALDAVQLNLDEVRRILSTPVVPPPPPPPPGYTLSPGQDPAEAIADLSAGDTLWLADGVHPYRIHLTKPLNVRAAEGAAPLVSGWRPMAWDVVSSDAGRVLYRTPWNREAMGLSHHIVTNAAFRAAPDGPARMAAHNWATQPEIVRYEGDVLERVRVTDVLAGEYRQAFDDKAGYLYASIQAGDDPGLLEVATLPQLFTADEGVAGITVEVITFTGAANTHKQGAFTLHSDGNTLRNLAVDTVNSLGYSIRGIGLAMDRVRAIDAGQMGHWMKINNSTVVDCGHSGSNWRGSDAGWHASNKWEQCTDNMVSGWYAHNSDGPGLWLDIGNHRNTFTGLDLFACGKNALVVEHYAEGNVFSGEISGTHGIGRWAGADIQIQSNVKGNVFDGINIRGDMVPFWLVYKTSEARGPSGPNTFRNINAGGRPISFQPTRHEKDRFEVIT